LFHFEFKSLNSKEKRIIFDEESTFIHVIELTKTTFSGIIFEAGKENLTESSVGVWRRIISYINQNCGNTDGIKLSFFSDRNLLLNNVRRPFSFCIYENFIDNSVRIIIIDSLDGRQNFDRIGKRSCFSLKSLDSGLLGSRCCVIETRCEVV
jgi:hypothetical protein